MCNCTLTCGDSASKKIVLKMLIDLENIFFSLSLTQYTLLPTQTHNYMSEILLDKFLQPGFMSMQMFTSLIKFSGNHFLISPP